MPRTLVRDLRDHLGQTVTICGWINLLRLQRTMQFVILRDPSGMVQITHKRGGDSDELGRVIESRSDETAVVITASGTTTWSPTGVGSTSSPAATSSTGSMRDGHTRHARHFVRLFTYTELCGWLLDMGFARVNVYGEDGQPLALGSKRMIAVAQRQ